MPDSIAFSPCHDDNVCMIERRTNPRTLSCHQELNYGYIIHIQRIFRHQRRLSCFPSPSLFAVVSTTILLLHKESQPVPIVTPPVFHIFFSPKSSTRLDSLFHVCSPLIANTSGKGLCHSHPTLGQKTVELIGGVLGHWLICSLVCSVHSFACTALLALLGSSAAFICSLTRSRAHENQTYGEPFTGSSNANDIRMAFIVLNW